MVTVSDKISPGINSWVSKPEWRPQERKKTKAFGRNGSVKEAQTKCSEKRINSRTRTRRNRQGSLSQFQDDYVILEPSNGNARNIGTQDLPSCEYGTPDEKFFVYTFIQL